MSSGQEVSVDEAREVLGGGQVIVTNCFLIDYQFELAPLTHKRVYTHADARGDH